MDATPERDTSTPSCTGLAHTYTVGLARVFVQLRVLLLDHILDMLVVALLDLSENRDSASRVSLCQGL